MMRMRMMFKIPDSTMHGIFLLSTLDYVKKLSGKGHLNDHLKIRGIELDSNDVNSINCFNEITYRPQKFTETSIGDFYEMIGRHFIRYLLESNYESILSSLGRDFKSFLEGFDNFQDYLKFTFPKDQSPLFTKEAETKRGLRLTCMSKEKELISYAKGIITEIGVSVYKKDIIVAEVCENQSRFGTKLTIQIYFENQLTLPRDIHCFHPKNFPINPSIIGKIFPFSIIISTNMVVKGLGFSLLPVIPFAVEDNITRNFQLNRPWIPMEFKSIMIYSSHVFDLYVSKKMLSTKFEKNLGDIEINAEDSQYLRLKGKLFFVRKWQSVIFMGVPVVPTLSNLTSLGLHISDLAIHDSSRDYMLAEAQQTMEYKLTFEQGEEKQKRLERSLVKLEEEMKRTQTILNYLVPEQSAISLKKGIVDIDSCKVIENVTILVSDIVKFTVVCSTLKPMEVVTTLNAMYSGYDTLTAKHGVCKIETVGDAYMVVSNTFSKRVPSADKVCDVALDMLETIKSIKNPETGVSLKVRIGINTGPAVAGIVGLKVPKFCIFGTSVKTAITLEASSLPMKIKISQSTRNLLNSNYMVCRSGTIYTSDNVKVETYWLMSRPK